MPKAAQAEPAAEEAWEEEGEEEPPVLGAEVAYAKSGRSLCKECREPIAQGALRIGADFVMGEDHAAAGKVLTSWRHPECFSLPENECKTIEDLRGFAELPAKEQKAVRAAIEGGMMERGELEYPEEEEEEPAPPPKKRKKSDASEKKKKAKSAEKKPKRTEEKPKSAEKKEAAKPKSKAKKRAPR